MTSIELEIQEKLKQGVLPNHLGHQLLLKTEDPHTKPEDIALILNFLAAAGLKNQILQFYFDRLDSSTLFLWGPLLRILPPQGAFLPLIKALYKGLKSKKQLVQLIPARHWDPIISNFESKRLNALKDWDEKRRIRKVKLIEKLDFLRQQRLVEQQQEVIDQLQTFFPDDLEVQQIQKHYRQTWARHIIHRNRRPDQDDKIDPLPQNQVSLEEEQWIQSLVVTCQEKLNKNPTLSYDLALLFYFLDRPLEALKIMEGQTLTLPMKWLELELLLACRRSVDCLDRVTQIEQLQGGDPETTFAVAYIRARAYYQLGQSDKALSFIRSILRIRPTYRSAESLLMEWKKRERL